RLNAALREPQERGAGAGPARELLGSGKGFLGALEVAETAPDVTHLGERRGGVWQMAADQFGTRLVQLALGVDQGALPIEHDRVVDPADARKDRKRMLLCPPSRGVSPLGRPTQIADVLARADQAAVHLAGRVRAQATFDGQEHGLVEMRESEPNPAGVDEHPADGLERFGLEVGRAEAAAECEGLLGQGRSVVEPSTAVCDLGLAQEQRAVLDALRVTLERPPGSLQPAGGDRGPGPEGVMFVEPDRALAGAALIAELLEGAVGALAGVDAL